MPRPSAPYGFTRIGFFSALILFIAALPVAGQSPQPNKPQTEDVQPLKSGVAGGQDRISEIEIRGNVRVPTSTLRKSISIRMGDIYDPAKIERDVAALRSTGYFDDIRAETKDDPAGVKGCKIVTFFVQEKKVASASPEAAPFDLTDDYPSDQAQGDAAPFVLKTEIYIYSRNPEGEQLGTQTIARRSDGYTVLEDNFEPMTWGMMAQKVTEVFT